MEKDKESKKKPACTTPSVQKCLHCTEPECTCRNRVPPTPDEIEALKIAGMWGRHNVTAVYKRAERELKSGNS